MLGRRAPSARARARNAQIAALCVGALACLDGARAEDVQPKVAPEMIADVPSTKPDPFPAFDNFAWRAFVALSWPARIEASHRGEPDLSKSLRDPGPRVWETFKSRYEVFRRNARGRATTPAGWNSYAGRDPCGLEPTGPTKTLAAFEPYTDFNQATFTAGRFASPLIAQNRTYVRYESRLDSVEFQSILAHGWYDANRGPTVAAPARFEPGSIEVKAAWRILNFRDDAATRKRYYVVSANVLDVAKTRQSGVPTCSLADVALVGLHIAVKTKYRPQWIWSSFEHVDNVPPIGKDEAREPDARDAGAPYSFNNPMLPQDKITPPMDSPLAWPVDADNPPRVDPEPMQVVRKHPINPETMAMNRAYWALPEIRGSVWEHYMLVVSQWPTVTQPPSPENDGAYFPGLRISKNTPVEPYQSGEGDGDPNQNLVNVTMETYGQDSPASCMACHHVTSNAQGRDFVAILPLAKR